MSKKVKKVVKIIFWVFLALVALYSIIIMAEKIIWKDKTPSFFGYKNFIVLTGSMEPTLSTGDVVFVKEDDNIEVGDIIAFHEDGAVVTHRVTEVITKNNRKEYRTKGDANNDEDIEIIETDDIEGKFAFKISKLGSIILFFKTPAGIFILLSIFLVGFFIANTNLFDKKEKVKKKV